MIILYALKEKNFKCQRENNSHLLEWNDNKLGTQKTSSSRYESQTGRRVLPGKNQLRIGFVFRRQPERFKGDKAIHDGQGQEWEPQRGIPLAELTNFSHFE